MSTATPAAVQALQILQ